MKSHGFRRPLMLVAVLIAAALAMGAVSPSFALTSNSGGNPSASLDQWANLDNQWVNGNLGGNKAEYLEGDSVPYRMRFDNLSLTSHTVTIEWDTTKSSKHALDYLTTYNRTVQSVDPCAGVASCGSSTTFVIPADQQVTGPNMTPIAGDFTLFGGSITGVSAYSYADGTGFTGDKSARIMITFTPSVANPVLAWGGHISTRLDWGETNSAVTISGSPYHMRLIDLDGSGGNQDRSLSNDAVIFPGSITIIKDATPNGSTSFGFTASPSPLSNFSLVDDGTSANTKVFSNISTFQNYTINETSIPTDWGFDSVSCSVASPNGGSYTKSTTTVNITMKEGENWNCTYLNSVRTGTLIVKKVVVNDNGGKNVVTEFAFKVDGGSATNFTQDTDTIHGKNTLTVAAGSHSVTEPAVAGYTATYANSLNSNTDCNNLVVPAGGSVTCTITNDDQPGTLIVIKHLVNDNGGTAKASDFTMSVTGSSPSPASFPGAESPGTTFTLDPGSYSMSESGPSGYKESDSADCSGAIIAGQTKTCTVTNDDNAPALHLRKTVVNDNGGTAADTAWTLTADGGAAGKLSGVTPVDSGPTFKAGTYTLSEGGGPSGYTSSDWSCLKTGTNTPVTVTSSQVIVGLGDDITCTITNNDIVPRLTVIKHVVGGTASASQFTLTVTGTNVSPASSFQGAESPGRTVTLNAGSYSVDEGAVSGYTKTLSTDCSGTIAVGETKTCTVTNTVQPGSIAITKLDDANPANKVSGAAFTVYKDSGFSQVAGGCSTTDTNPCTVSNLSAADYWVKETTTPTGYSTSSPDWQKVTVAAGEIATVTFTDPRNFKIIVLVCQVSDNQLYASTVSLDAGTTGVQSLGPNGGGTVTDSSLCGLGGAAFSPEGKGSHTASITIP